MFARVTVSEGASSEAIDEGLRIGREQVLPKARQMEGWKGIISLADRSTGKQLLITLWESEETMHASADRAKALRSEARSGAEQEGAVEAYEVLLLETE